MTFAPSMTSRPKFPLSRLMDAFDQVVEPLFAEWLSRHAPTRKDKVLGRVRSVRGGIQEPAYTE